MDKKFKMFVIIAISLLTIILIAIGCIVLMPKDTAGVETEVQQTIAKKDLEVHYMEETLNANLKVGEDGIAHMVQLALGVEVNMKDKDYKTFIETFAKDQIIIRDAIIRIVRATTYEQMMLETAQEDLAAKIVTRMNELLDTQIVQDVYFKNFFVQ